MVAKIPTAITEKRKRKEKKKRNVKHCISMFVKTYKIV